MKRILAFSILMVFLFSVAAQATDTRVMTMGEVNEVVKDDANIWLYPQTIAMYPNMFVGEFDGDDFDMLGGHWAMGDYTLGAYFQDMSGYYLDGVGWNGWIDNDYNFRNWWHDREGRYLSHRIDLFWGMNFSDMPWGLRISAWKEGESFVGDENFEMYDMDNSYKRYEFSLGTTLMEGKLDAAFTMGMNSWTEECTYEDSDGDLTTYEPSEKDSSNDMDFRLRYWYEKDEQWTLIPHGSFSTGKHAVLYNDWYDGPDPDDPLETLIEQYQDYSFEAKMSAIVLGVGTNFQVNDDVMTVTDFGFQFWTMDYTDTTVYNYNEMVDHDFDPATPDISSQYSETMTFEGKENVIPYFKIGLDANVLKWLDVRCGAYTIWDSYTDTGDFSIAFEDQDYGEDDAANGEYKENDAYTNLYLGVGLHWGDLELDAELNTDFMENGPYFVSGEYDYLFHRVSMKYNF